MLGNESAHGVIGLVSSTSTWSSPSVAIRTGWRMIPGAALVPSCVVGPVSILVGWRRLISLQCSM